MWFYWLMGFLTGLGTGAVIINLLARRLRKAAMPYRWACEAEGCTFSIESSEHGMVLRWIDQHTALHHHDCT